MIKISAFVIVRNEEKKIERCLDSLKWCDEIVLIDQSSDDKTVDLAKKYTKKIFIKPNSGYCEVDRNFAISQTKNEWNLMLDADEVITDGLRKEIVEELEKNSGKIDVFFIPRRTYFLGRWIKGCGWYPGYVPRLFKKGSVIFDDKLHMDGRIISERIKYLKNHIEHYSYDSIEDWINKMNRYTTITAFEYFKFNKRIDFISNIKEILIKPFYFFILKYFWLKGYKDGWRGVFISFSSAFTLIISYFKFLEIKDKNEKNSF